MKPPAVCSVCDASPLPARPWCSAHAPVFLGRRPARFDVGEVAHLVWAADASMTDAALPADVPGIWAFGDDVRAAYARIVGCSPLRLDLRSDRR